jgi:hypothetical protein
MASSSNSKTKMTAKKESNSVVPAKMEEAKTINKGFVNAKPANSTTPDATNREPNHASVEEGKHTTVPDANTVQSSKHNENIYKPATSLGEEYSCKNAAADGCKTFPYMDHSYVEGSESSYTEAAASYPAFIQPNFHNEFIRDHASRAAQLYQEKSASVASTFIVDNDKNVQVKIPVKSVLCTVSDKNKEGVIEFGLSPMCKVGDGGKVIVHKNADNTRQLLYSDGSGKTLFRTGSSLFDPWTVIKGNAGQDPVFYMDAVNIAVNIIAQRQLCPFFFEFDNKHVFASALGHIFYDDMTHLTKFFDLDEMKNRFLAISKSVPDHVIKHAESAMEVDIEVDKGESQLY